MGTNGNQPQRVNFLTPINLGDLFQKSWDSIKNQLGLICGLSLVYFLGGSTLSMIPAIGWMLSGPFTAGFMRCLIRLKHQEPLEFSDVFWGFLDFNRFIHLVLCSFLTTLMVGLGLLFFVIPGIFFFVATCLATSSMVMHEVDSIEAIKRSMEMVRGRWFETFLLLVCVGMLNIVGTFCLIIGLLVTIPMSFLLLIHLNQFLSAEKGYRIVGFGDGGGTSNSSTKSETPSKSEQFGFSSKTTYESRSQENHDSVTGSTNVPVATGGSERTTEQKSDQSTEQTTAIFPVNPNSLK